MANRTSWVAGNGQGLSYGTAGFTAANFNSLAAGSCVVATSAITNSSSLDLYAMVSFILTVGGTTVSSSYMSLYMMPLNQDGSTYGDGTTTGATAPSTSYLVGNVGVQSGITSGNTVVGTFPTVFLRPTNFVFVIVNNLTVALNAAAAASVKYITFNENLND